ncbi:MAG: thermonuclease family protein [Planctomycetota bacterium]
MKKKSTTTYISSRHKKRALLSLLLVAVAFLIWYDRHYFANKWPQTQTEQQKNTSDFSRYHGKIFRVLKVVDGDTLDIDEPDGQDDTTRIRLWGVDTPETKNPSTGQMFFGPQASDFTTKSTLNKQVTVFLDEGNNTRGKYGRLLAYIQLPDGRFVNEALLTGGFGYADVRFKHSFYHKYQQLETAARSQKKGLWQEVKREQLPIWLQREKPKLLLEK